MLPRPAAITLTLLASCQWVREAIGAMQNSLTGWHPANRIRGRLPQAIQEGRRYDELATLAWKGRFGGTGNFPANGSNQLPSWKNKVRLRGSWRTLDPWPPPPDSRNPSLFPSTPPVNRLSSCGLQVQRAL